MTDYGQFLMYVCVSGDEQIQFSEPASKNVKDVHKCNILLHVLIFYIRTTIVNILNNFRGQWYSK
jgi:hypothetical protein